MYSFFFCQVAARLEKFTLKVNGCIAYYKAKRELREDGLKINGSRVLKEIRVLDVKRNLGEKLGIGKTRSKRKNLRIGIIIS